MIILGVDPGTAETGFGVIEKSGRKLKKIYHCCFKTKATEKKQYRLKQIYDELNKILLRFRVEVLVMESLFFNTNAKSASAVGQAMGAIMVAAANQNIPVIQYSPLQIKKILTGYGRAEKKQLQNIVKKKLKLKKVPRPVHAADALAAAICYALKIE